MVDRDKLIYDWNEVGNGADHRPRSIEFEDETLRDGLQSASAHTPTVEQRVEILRLMDAMGLDAAAIGLPGAGRKACDETLAIARGIAEEKLRIAPTCAARTLEQDIRPIVEISQKIGRPIEAGIFIGSSPIRRYAEDWTLERMLEHTRNAVSFAVRNGLPVLYVTEDTSRARPADIRSLYLAAIEAGAARICLCDTVGHCTPNGAFQLVAFARNMLEEEKISGIGIGWHGHMDRGLAVWNAISALTAGANRVHGTALGIGERVGNAPMDQILVNLKLLGWIGNDLSKLDAYCRAVSEYTRIPIPAGYPVVGSDAFRTATGIHAAAILKALRKGDPWLADRVYSSVPAADFGRRQQITIGPMSGRSNVLNWLQNRDIETREELVQAVLERAKHSRRLLTDEEIEEAIRSVRP